MAIGAGGPVPSGGIRPERPGDPGTEFGLGPAGEGRIGRSWRLTRVAWRLIRRDRTMLALAAASALLGLGATMALFWASGWFADPEGSRFRLLAVSAVAAWPLAVLANSLNVAIAAVAAARLEDRALRTGEALGVVRRRFGQIVLWSLLAAGVGAALGWIAERVPFGGRVATWVAGGAWHLATFFVVPILAVEGCTATGCVRRSSALLRARWAHAVLGSITITAWTVVVALPAALLLGAGMAGAGVVAAGAVALGLTSLVAVSAVAGAVEQVYAVVLYRYAADGAVRGGFARGDLERPFTPRRTWR